MSKKYYAVAKGKTPGIYLTWEACKQQVDQVSGAVYKSFPSLEEAKAFMEQAGVSSYQVEEEEDTVAGENTVGISTGESTKETNPVSTDTRLIAYVDGSYDPDQKKYAYGCALVLPEEVVTLNGSGEDPDYVEMRNVAGEILGSEKAVLWAIEHGYREVVIYYDYEGIEKWANDIWKANKAGTIRYKEFIAGKRKEISISFQKVAAHTGVTYNEMADRLAKEALGL